jgi:hypothetical protein
MAFITYRRQNLKKSLYYHKILITVLIQKCNGIVYGPLMDLRNSKLYALQALHIGDEKRLDPYIP